MLIWFVVGAIVLYLVVSNYFRKYRAADEASLRPMPEWMIIANSGTKNHKEKMSYSLIIQAANILEGLNVLPQKALRQVMIARPDISKASFVFFILQAAAYLDLETNEYIFLENSYDRNQARQHLAISIEFILKHGGAAELAQIAIKACHESV